MDLNKLEAFEHLVQKFEPRSKLLRLWELTGGISAQTVALEIERPDGQSLKMVVRQHAETGLKINPERATDEFKILEILHAQGLATPKPYYLDVSCDVLSTPYVIIEFIEGILEFAPVNLSDYLHQFATHLSRIYAVDCVAQELSFLPEQEKLYAARFRQSPVNLDASLDEGRIRDTLKTVWPLPKQNRTVLLHGDYWPGNILWKDGQLTAVIDWEDAQLGDPLADVAISRLDTVWAFGIEAMRTFTEYYRSMNAIDFTDLPYWDLCAALRPAGSIAKWAGEASKEKTMRAGHRLFIKQAFDAIASR